VPPRALAVGCHPDDIEFMMAGTLMLLARAGFEIHYMNLANGSCGTDRLDRETIVRLRTEEARTAADRIGAVFHEPLCDDLAVFYAPELTHRMGAVVRRIAPSIILTHGPNEYMEDHANTCRLTVTAAFCRAMLNFPTDPATPPIQGEVTIYHALPYGLMDPLRRPVTADLYVDIGSVLEAKREMLACHKSQKEWLDVSQGLDAYLTTLVEMMQAIGRMSGRFAAAEGWLRHSHLGFCAPEADPLRDALGAKVVARD